MVVPNWYSPGLEGPGIFAHVSGALVVVLED